MSLKVRCECGKILHVEERQAGKKARCPDCKSMVPIPIPGEDDGQAYEMAVALRCPQCKSEWEPGTAVCIDCGWNFRAGKAMKTRFRIQDRVLPGSYSFLGFVRRMVLSRGLDGKLRLNLYRRLLFIPRKTLSFRLTDFQQIVTDFSTVDNGETASDVFTVDLEGGRRKPFRVYNGYNQAEMKEVIDMLQAAAPHLEIIPRR
jgi:hypothetical protein